MGRKLGLTGIFLKRSLPVVYLKVNRHFDSEELSCFVKTVFPSTFVVLFVPYDYP
jgi:hypothetical protein